MWFKNLSVYRLTETLTLTPVELEQKLSSMIFQPCGDHQEFSFGWVAPLGKPSEQLVHNTNGFLMICAKKEEKVLPAAVVNEILQEKISEQEDQQSRKLSKKERSAMKDELVFELLPKAFTLSKKIYAYLDPKGGWLVADAASAKSAEDLISLLRKCLGSLPVEPITTIHKPSVIMTQWLSSDQLPGDIAIEDECELRAPGDEGGIIRCKRHDLTLPEIKNHLETGKQVIKLALSWAERIAFIIDESLSIKRLRFLTLVQDQVADIETDNAAEQFDADFSIMTMELANFLPRLLEIFGGDD